jgi:hypothetical protein
MASVENVTAARINTCVLKDTDILAITQTVTIHESICTPYLTGELIVLDNQNIIIDLKIKGGELCNIGFDAPLGKRSYDVDTYVLDVKSSSAEDNMMLKIYTISVVTSEYFTDRGTLTPGNLTSVGMTGVALAQQIWSEAGFKTRLIPPVTDNPLQDGENSLTITHQKPFTAVGQIRDIQVYPQYPTGNVLLYRNHKAVIHVPLQHIYETCSATEKFIQKETWGSDWRDMFVNDDSIRVIMDVKNVSRDIMLDPDEFKPTDQKQRAFDIKKGKMAVNIFQGLMKGSGVNIPSTDSQKTSPSIDFTSIIEKTRWYAHCLKSRPQYLVKIPLNSGINITVGEGCELTFTPLHSSPNQLNKANGLYLITDLVHEVHRDLRKVLGTTTINALSAKSEDRSKCSVK